MSAITAQSNRATGAQRSQLRRDGFLTIKRALEPEVVERLASALGRVDRDERAQGDLQPGQPMHLLGQIGRDDAFLDLLDHPAVFPVICDELGWNIHIYHCHLDVTPPRAALPERPTWGWHQDGGRQNLEIDGDPRARLSLKVCYWLSDLTEPGRGNMLVIPGSHERNVLSRPDPRACHSEQPADAVAVLADPGDALIFDRRLWHSRSHNQSSVTRKAIFLAYTYRWIRPRDKLDLDHSDPRFARLSPVRRQLLDAPAGPWSHWGLHREDVPLHAEMARRGLLNEAIPWLR
jgi:hypothetical protein